MPSFSAMSIMAAGVAGAGIAGYGAWKHSAKDESMDTQDRIGYAASMGIAGAAAGLALKRIGGGRLLAAGKYGAKGAGAIGKMMMANPLKDGLVKRGVKFGWNNNKMLHGPMTMLALSAATVGGIAYSRSREEQGETTYAERGRDGQTQYSQQSIKERMGMLGATGDMVFGLNNSRHG